MVVELELWRRRLGDSFVGKNTINLSELTTVQADHRWVEMLYRVENSDLSAGLVEVRFSVFEKEVPAQELLARQEKRRQYMQEIEKKKADLAKAAMAHKAAAQKAAHEAARAKARAIELQTRLAATMPSVTLRVMRDVTFDVSIQYRDDHKLTLRANGTYSEVYIREASDNQREAGMPDSDPITSSGKYTIEFTISETGTAEFAVNWNSAQTGEQRRKLPRMTWDDIQDPALQVT